MTDTPAGMIKVDFRSLDDASTYMYAHLPALPAVGDIVTVTSSEPPYTSTRLIVVDRPRLWFPAERNPALQKVVVYVAPES